MRSRMSCATRSPRFTARRNRGWQNASWELAAKHAAGPMALAPAAAGRTPWASSSAERPALVGTPKMASTSPAIPPTGEGRVGVVEQHHAHLAAVVLIHHARACTRRNAGAHTGSQQRVDSAVGTTCKQAPALACPATAHGQCSKREPSFCIQMLLPTTTGPACSTSKLAKAPHRCQ